MLSIEEKQKVIRIRIRDYLDAINLIGSSTPLLVTGDAQIEINSLEYSNLVKCVKALENELNLLTNNDQ